MTYIIIAIIFIFFGFVKFDAWKRERHYKKFYVEPVLKGRAKAKKHQEKVNKRLSKSRPRRYVRVNGGQGFWLGGATT